MSLPVVRVWRDCKAVINKKKLKLKIKKRVSVAEAYIAYVSIRQHTSAYVSIRQHTSASVSTSA